MEFFNSVEFDRIKIKVNRSRQIHLLLITQAANEFADCVTPLSIFNNYANFDPLKILLDHTIRNGKYSY